jgi:hypothetical protein
VSDILDVNVERREGGALEDGPSQGRKCSEGRQQSNAIALLQCVNTKAQAMSTSVLNYNWVYSIDL